ncbi:hypothetical protein CTAYLR_009925 [Chrysophaeum taylorii]|uniref:Cytochrome b5 heme-binding domain-containing protein n=1 Tax=Chrysophaeum taylorii TaxID=2483200 RepID=A0AAD7UHV8_9STRA|nr:hypothetical protein CTAYLR_009925 [Chrysophaeum taylorii]
MAQGLTLDEVATHNHEKDCYLIIGNTNNGGPKVYDVTKYLDDHPGGAEVMLELAGKYADDMFEDIGHSNEARKQLKQFLVGPLDATDEEIEKLGASSTAASGASSGGATVGFFVVVVAVGLGLYFYTQS